MDDIFQIFSNGGPVVIPIVLCSIIAFSISIERWFALRPDKIIPSSLVDSILSLLKNGEWTAAEQIALKDRTPLGRMVAVILKYRKEERSYITTRAEELARQEMFKMERSLEVISVIASIAPMLGLMGTVLGMVVTFESIQIYGLGDIDSLAGGISQALLTTLAGLIVGVPSLIAHRYFISLVDKHMLQLEAVATQLLEQVEQLR